MSSSRATPAVILRFCITATNAERSMDNRASAHCSGLDCCLNSGHTELQVLVSLSDPSSRVQPSGPSDEAKLRIPSAAVL